MDGWSEFSGRVIGGVGLSLWGYLCSEGEGSTVHAQVQTLRAPQESGVEGLVVRGGLYVEDANESTRYAPGDHSTHPSFHPSFSDSSQSLIPIRTRLGP